MEQMVDGADLHVRQPGPDLRVAFVLSQQFTLLPFSGFMDTLRHAADEGDRSRQIYCQWEIVGPTLEPVPSSGGAEIRPWKLFPDPDAYDCIVLVGGLLPVSAKHPEETLDFLRRASDRKKLIVGLCTGSFTLAQAGLLDGKRCAVHFRHGEEFRRRHPSVRTTTHEIFVIDDNIITCPGGTAAIDVAVEIISRCCGRARATKGLADMIVDEHRAAFHTPRLPFDELETCGDYRVERAVKIMRQNLSQAGTIADIASRIGLSASQLNRAFRARSQASPAAIWRAIRLKHGRWRVLNSSRTITEIAFECGFSDCSHFIRWFRKTYGETPQEARARRAPAANAFYLLDPEF